MNFLSTRGQSEAASAAEALMRGSAPDGGLYLPEHLPDFAPDAFSASKSLAALGEQLLTLFFADSPLAADMADIAADTFNFAAPVLTPDAKQPDLHVLELFHGPTGAFKDFGARFLFRALDRLAEKPGALTVLAATSGDTGGAVGCAAEGGQQARAVILFPAGRISAFQEHQLCCWKSPVRALRVDGDFDACQRMVKSAFADPALAAQHGLTSANSISVGRLLPQMTYWAHAALAVQRQTGQKPGLIVPTGNLGNAFAAVFARALGLPIGPIVLATNANSTLSDWHTTGAYEPRASLATLANAMDVGAPSNFERLAHFDAQAIHRVIRVGDDAIKARIRTCFDESGYVACPHTATGLEALDRLPEHERADRPWIVAATAHPYKFADVVEPLIGQTIDAPPALRDVLNRPVDVTDIKADLSDLAEALEQEAAPA